MKRVAKTLARLAGFVGEDHALPVSIVDRELFLKIGLTSEQVSEAADAIISGEFEWSENDVKSVILLSHCVRDILLDYVKAIHLFIEIIKKTPHRSDVYHCLNNIYLYDIRTVEEFDFLDNALKAFTVPRPDVDPMFYAMTYTYIGWLYQRLGKVWDAKTAFSLTAAFRNDSRRITRTADYGMIELDFIADACSRSYALPEARDGRRRMMIGTILFGTRYVDMLLNVACRTLFSGQNLKALQHGWDAGFVIFAPSGDILKIRRSPMFAWLSAQLPIELVVIPLELLTRYPDDAPNNAEFHPGMPYAVSGLAQICMAEIARRHQCDLVILPPDTIFTDRVFDTIASALADGKQVLCTPGLSVNRDEACRDLAGRENEADSPTLALSPAQLNQMALANLHPVVRASFMTEPKVTYPGMVWWPVGKDGLFGHAFQVHPLFLTREVLDRGFLRRMDSVDGDFLFELLPDEKDWSLIEIVGGAQDTLMWHLADSASVHIDQRFNSARLVDESAAWVTGVMRPLSYWFFRQPLAFGDVTGPEATRLRAHADSIVAEFTVVGRNLHFLPSQNHRRKECAESQLNALVVDRQQNAAMVAQSFADLRQKPRPWESLKVIYSLAVWGREYVDNFLRVCLPSMLAPGNLGDNPTNPHSLLLVYTRAVDRAALEEDPTFQKLMSMIPVELVDIDAQQFGNKYSVLGSAQSHTVQRSRGFDSIIFLYSDFVWSRGAMVASLRRLAEGYDGVVSPVPPLVREDFFELTARCGDEFHRADGNAAVIDIAPRDLIRHGKPILHPMMRDNTMNFARHTGNPAYVLWNGPGDDFLIRCFHAHPVALRVMPEKPEYWQPFIETLDEFFLPKVYDNIDNLYYVEDSDEIAVVSLTERDFPVPYVNDTHRLTAGYITRWAEACAAPMHKLLFSRASFWHEHDIDHAAWEPMVKRSQRLAEEVLHRLTLPDSVLMAEDHLQYLARSNRVRRKGGEMPAAAPTAICAAARPKGQWIFHLFRLLLKPLTTDIRRKMVLSLPHSLREWVITVRELR